MTAPLWQPGQLYSPGDVVSPRTTLPVLATAIENPSFEADTAGWTGISGNWSIDTTDPFQGSKRLKWTGVTSDARVYNDAVASVAPGQRVTARVYIERFGAADQQGGYASLAWYDADDILLQEDVGNEVGAPGFGWRLSTVSGVAPAGAAKVQFYVRAFALQGGSVVFDAASWDYVFQGVPTGLLFTAVQTDPARSAADEPDWPTTNGSTVVDGGVTWEASFANRVVWRAFPILKSGATEPVWPETPGTFVSDGTISWETVVRNITDPRCPNTKVVAIGASKVFCGDDDIIAYSATANPLDWSSADDAGFLPFGLQQYGANPVAALGLYRSNLVGWNSQGMQIWQIDEDPARMQLLDAIPIGSTFPQAVSPVMNDLLFLTQLGVRSIGIAGASTNLAAGDVGSPIDPLVRAAIAQAENQGTDAISTYYPALGQYILSFRGEFPEPTPTPPDAPDGSQINAWGYMVSSGGIAIDPEQEYNAVLASADSVVVYGYLSDGGAGYDSFPDPLEVPYDFTIGSNEFFGLENEIQLTTGNTGPGTSIWYAPYEETQGSMPDVSDDGQSGVLVALRVTWGETVTLIWAGVFNAGAF